MVPFQIVFPRFLSSSSVFAMALRAGTAAIGLAILLGAPAFAGERAFRAMLDNAQVSLLPQPSRL
jgi:hypothetical protein